MNALFNQARGETALEINGRQHRLCLTLGALAELEAAFDAHGFNDLAEKLAHLSASDMLVVLAALTGGGGEAVTTGDLARAQIDPRAAAQAVAEAFRNALTD
ncbi:MAG: gene transfer agent family protein [Alphaproteobacteria bacterium]|nr:gene transfer agent family protein [Alphaproteobacteria bacterium]